MAAAESPQPSIQIGDRVPFCCGMTNEKAFYSFDAQAGRPAVLILAGCLSPSATHSLADAFSHYQHDFAGCETDVLLLVSMQSAHMFEYNEHHHRGIRTVFCIADFFQGCGLEEPTVLVIDRGARVLARIIENDGAKAVQSALASLRHLPVEPSRDVLLPAPVLLIPNLISREFCLELIHHFEANPHSDGGMASIDSAGNPYHKIDHDKKKREDCVITPSDSVHDRILDALASRCLPEIKKAFQFDACFTDRILIARYDHTGGYFLRHRDNVAPSVAFRQFAISLNLNDDYEGGYLLFPEYNSHRYRPPGGSGIVFSASLLHEATVITGGSRYVLLTFFHNQQAEMQRTQIVADSISGTSRHAAAS